MCNHIVPLSRTQQTDINAALTAMPPEKTSQYLNEMLDNIQTVRISLLGSHLIGIRGFSGESPIENIIRRFFLHASKDLRLHYRIRKVCTDFDREQSDYIFGVMVDTASQKFEQIERENNSLSKK